VVPEESGTHRGNSTDAVAFLASPPPSWLDFDYRQQLAAEPGVEGLRSLGGLEMKHRKVAVIAKGGKRIRRPAEFFGEAEGCGAVYRAAHRLGRQLDAVWPVSE
jgi:hypothetical protein